MTDTAPPRTERPADGAPRQPRDRTRFRPSSRRWNRIALGVALIAIAIGGNALVYSSLNESQPVVQVVRDVPAGTQLTADMLRTVDATIDGSVNALPGERLDSIVGSYAKVRLVSGTLVTEQSLQSTPLVTPGSAIVAIQVADGAVPVGLRERVPVELVIPLTSTATGEPPSDRPVAITGRVVGLPTETSDALGMLSLSVEVAAADAATVAAADDVRIVLLTPSNDPAADPGPSDELVPDDSQASQGGDG